SSHHPPGLTPGRGRSRTVVCPGPRLVRTGAGHRPDPTDFERSELLMSDVVSLLSQIEETGRDTRGPGYQRPGFSDTERDLREWFLAEAARRGLDTEIDANGITWAWATPPGENAVVTGSHL